MQVFVGCETKMNDKARNIMGWLSARLPNVTFIHWADWFSSQPNNEVTWEGIMQAACGVNINGGRYFDSAIMLFSGDDNTTIRGKEYLTTRDNVIFETGVFACIMSKEKVFILKDTRANYHFPSDFEGLNPKRFDFVSDHTISANQAILDEIVRGLENLAQNYTQNDEKIIVNKIKNPKNEAEQENKNIHPGKIQSRKVKNF